MIISKEILVNTNAVKFSPCGKFLALAFSNDLNIVKTSDFVKIFNVQCSTRIISVDWSIDSDHILCVVATGSVEVFSMSSPEWSCTIDEGSVGLSSAVWSPKGTHIVTVAQFAVRLSIWSLIGRSVAFIEGSLMKAKDKLSFSPDGGSLAVITGNIGQLNISVFSTSWTEMSLITCTRGITVPSVPLWSPNDSFICIWDRNDLTTSTLQIYKVATKEMVGDFKMESKNWEPRGISAVIWTPNSQFLLIGCRNERIYVLNYINWSVIAVFRHEKVIDENCDVMRELNGHFLSVTERPVKFVSTARKLPGITKMAVSRDGILIASFCRLLPAVVWLWHLDRCSILSIVIFKNRIADVKWGREHKLSICSGSKVTLWHPKGLNQIQLPNCGMKTKKCDWRGAGDLFLIFMSGSVFKVSGV